MAAKLIITRGLPASGKSTWAANHVLAEQADRIVCMDDIRTFLNAEFPHDEKLVQKIRNLMIQDFLRRNLTVISSDTNLNPSTVSGLIELAELQEASVEFKDFTDVPLATCLERNAERRAGGDFKVPDQAIVKMHDQYLSKA